MSLLSEREITKPLESAVTVRMRLVLVERLKRGGGGGVEQAVVSKIDWKLNLSENKERLIEHFIAFANYSNGGYLALKRNMAYTKPTQTAEHKFIIRVAR